MMKRRNPRLPLAVLALASASLLFVALSAPSLGRRPSERFYPTAAASQTPADAVYSADVLILGAGPTALGAAWRLCEVGSAQSFALAAGDCDCDCGTAAAEGGFAWDAALSAADDAASVLPPRRALSALYAAEEGEWPPPAGSGDVWRRLAQTIALAAPDAMMLLENASVEAIDLSARTATLRRAGSGQRAVLRFRTLVNTLLPQVFADLVSASGAPMPRELFDAIEKAVEEVPLSTVHVFGVGLCGCSEPPLPSDMHTQMLGRSFRISVPSRASPLVAPAGKCFSLLVETVETGENVLTPAERASFPEAVFAEMKAINLVQESCAVRSRFYSNQTVSDTKDTEENYDTMEDLQEQLYPFQVFTPADTRPSFSRGVALLDQVAPELPPQHSAPIDMLRFAALVADKNAQSTVSALSARGRPVSLKLQREVVVAHYNENVSWTSELPPWVKVSIYTHAENVSGGRFTTPNYGREAHLYLQFIEDNYYKLPSRMFFMHGHQSAWHLRDAVRAVQCADWSSPRGFYGVSDKGWHHFKMPETSDEDLWAAARFWDDLLKPVLGVMPRKFQLVCCATFVVRRDRVLARPLEEWRALRAVAENKSIEDWTIGVTFEYLWPRLMGEPYWQEPFDDGVSVC